MHRINLSRQWRLSKIKIDQPELGLVSDQLIQAIEKTGQTGVATNLPLEESDQKFVEEFEFKQTEGLALSRVFATPPNLGIASRVVISLNANSQGYDLSNSKFDSFAAPSLGLTFVINGEEISPQAPPSDGGFDFDVTQVLHSALKKNRFSIVCGDRALFLKWVSATLVIQN